MVQSTSHLLNVLLKMRFLGSCVGITAENSPEITVTVQEVMKEMLKRRDLSCFFHSAETWM